MVDVLALPDDERQLVTWITRQRAVTLAEAAEQLGRDEAETGALLDDLARRGFVELTGERTGEASATRYRVRLGPTRRARLPGKVWDALGG